MPSRRVQNEISNLPTMQQQEDQEESEVQHMADCLLVDDRQYRSFPHRAHRATFLEARLHPHLQKM